MARRSPNEWMFLGADGMNRSDPTPFVRGEDRTPWPFIELVNVDAVELPVIQGRMAFRDPSTSTATTWPRKK